MKYILTILALLLCSCGAPTKSSSSVANIFNGDSADIQKRTSDTCTAAFADNRVVSSLAGVFQTGHCNGANTFAMQLNSSDKLEFHDLNVSANNYQADVIHKQYRVQVKLGYSILNIAARVPEIMQKMANQANQSQNYSIPGSIAQKQGLVKSSVKRVGDPHFDLANKQLDISVDLAIEGIATLQNRIDIHGYLINDAIVTTFTTPQKQEYAASMLRNLKGMMVIIPTNGDVYADIFLDVEINSPGISPLVEPGIKQGLDTGIQSMLSNLKQY